MDLQNAQPPQSGRLRVVFPFDLEELGPNRDPNFWIKVKEENLFEVGTRMTKFKIKAGVEDHVKAIRAGMAAISDQIHSWGSADESVLPAPGLFYKGQPMECDGKIVIDVEQEGGKVTKQEMTCKRAFAETTIPVGDEWKTFWGLTTEAVDRQKREELGNAKSSSDTTSASA